jgi:hypothetical protein
MERVSDGVRLLPLDTRLQLVPAATRGFGASLLINVGGATAPVRRLDGAGPELWAAFAGGQTIAEAAIAMADRTNASLPEVERVVRTFATQLVGAGLAEPTC